MRILTLIFTAMFAFSLWAQESADDELDFDDAPAQAAPPSDDPTVPPPAAVVPADEDPTAEEPAPPPPPPKPKKKKRLAKKKYRKLEDAQKSTFIMAGLTYSMANKVAFSKSKVTVGASSTSESLNLGVDPGMGLSFGYMHANTESWGYGGNFIYEMARDVKPTSSSGIVINSGAKIQLMVLEGNGVYRWQKMFVPFGLNYTIASYTKAPADTGSTKMNGGLGGQGGVGYILNEKFVFDGGIRMQSIDATTTGSGFKIAYGLGYLTGIYIRGAYAF